MVININRWFVCIILVCTLLFGDVMTVDAGINIARKNLNPMCRCEKYKFDNKPFVALWNSPTIGYVSITN